MLRRLPPSWPAALLVTTASTGTAEPGSVDGAQVRGEAHGEPRDPAPAPVDGRGRYRRASLFGALLALVPNLALLVGGGFFRRAPLGGFYDAQAHSLLDLRWDVPPEVLSLEAFVVDGRSYTYFGPTPALLRLPVAAVTDRLDGRLTSLSLLLALVVTLVATTELGWRVRGLLRGQAPMTRPEAWAAVATTLLVGAGSVLLLLSSAPVVYHEAIAWGVALALAAYAALLAYTTGRRPRVLAAAVVLATLALLARPSVGLGPVLALGLLAAAEALAVIRRRGDGERRRRFVVLSLCAALPVVLYVSVNMAKFDTPVGVPWWHQANVEVDVDHREFLEQADGSLFGSEYVPTTLVAYLAPGALNVDRFLPWIDFPDRVQPVSDVRFLVVDRSPSVTTTMPWLLGLAAVGAVVLAARRSEPERRAGAALWALMVGAVAAIPVTLAIAYIAARYLADFIPLLLLPALVGLHALLGRRDRRWAQVALAGAGALGVAAVAVNLALAVQFQGIYGPATGEDQRARHVRLQTVADDVLPGDQLPHVRRLGPDDPLPEGGEVADLAVVADCAALYQHNGSSWRPVEQTSETGRLRVRTQLDAPGRGRSAELLVGGRGADARSLAVEVREDGRVVFVLRFGDRTFRGDPVEVGSGADIVDADFDRRLHAVGVEVEDRVVVGGVLYAAQDDALGVSPQWPGRAEVLPQGAPTCDGLDD